LELDKEPRINSHYVLDVTPEMLSAWQNLLQLKKSTTLPGQEISLDIHSMVKLRYVPDNTKFQPQAPIVGSKAPAIGNA
jgi:hypothetical protein